MPVWWALFGLVLVAAGVWWFKQPKALVAGYDPPHNLVASLCGADSTTLNARVRADFLLRVQENRRGEIQRAYPQLVEHPGLEGFLLSLPAYGKRNADGYGCRFVLPDGGNDTLVVFPEYYPPLEFRTASGEQVPTRLGTDNQESFHVLYQQTRQRYWMFVQMGWGYPGVMYGPFAEPASYPPAVAEQLNKVRRQIIADAGGIAD
ncbi:MAG TPA: hypothetical protein PKM88_13515 [bacterium]|nr:hypothetical protein [bacterium]